jgi:type IV pilus assembly protein PilX
MNLPHLNRRKCQAHLLQRQNQRGVVLILSLIMLTLMTIVGMAGVRLISTEERMVTQSFDRSVAFQATEAALREIEIRIEAAGQPSPTSSTCTLIGVSPNQVMTCGTLTTSTPRWISPSFTAWTNATKVGTDSFAVTPQYFVEYLGNTFPCSRQSADASTCKRYRITARANDQDRSAVMLQSIYSTYTP